MRLVFFLIFGFGLSAQTGENVVLIVNRNSETSRQIGDYYRVRRSIPIGNVCMLAASTDEEITWDIYVKQVEEPVANCLKKAGLIEKALYLVTTLGVPLKIEGAGARQMAEHSSVDSELALLYGKLHGAKYPRAGWISNPMFMRRDAVFQHPAVPIYAVTRLAAYDLSDVKAMVDRALQARNRGRFVLDLQSGKIEPGNDWLRTAAMLLPAARTTIESTTRVLYRQNDVIGYSSWGSNDDHRTERWLHFQWLPGAIASEFVSTSARTFKRPDDHWKPTSWSDKAHYFEGSPQGLVADLIHEGATGASGNTYEPYLSACPRPEYLLPAYYAGRNLADSFYIALPYLSWQSVILGDPLCSLGKP